MRRPAASDQRRCLRSRCRFHHAHVIPPASTHGVCALPLGEDLENLLRGLLAGLPFRRRAGIDQQARDLRMIALAAPVTARAFGGPDERLRIKLGVADVDGRTVCEQHAHDARPAFHRCSVQRGLADVIVLIVGIEAALEHELDRVGITELRGLDECDVMRTCDLSAQLRSRGKQSLRGFVIAAGASGHQAIDIGHVGGRALLLQPVGNRAIPVDQSDGVRRAAVGTPATQVSAASREFFGEGRIPGVR